MHVIFHILVPAEGRLGLLQHIFQLLDLPILLVYQILQFPDNLAAVFDFLFFLFDLVGELLVFYGDEVFAFDYLIQFFDIVSIFLQGLELRRQALYLL